MWIRKNKITIMRKIILLVVSFIISIALNANPLNAPLPPIINEIYFDSNGNWEIEFNTSFYWQIDFDLLSIETSSGLSTLKPGLNTSGSVLVITIDSLSSPLYINSHGDYIRIIGMESLFDSENYYFFGNYQFSQINEINSNQSFEVQCSSNGYFYYFAKQNIPTIGNENNYPATTGTFAGTIIDEDSLAIPNAKIVCKITSYNYESHLVYDWENYDVSLFYDLLIHSNNSGYFINSELQGRNYQLKFYSGDGNYLYDTTISITIEPDLVNNYLIKLNCNKIFVGINKVDYKDYQLRNNPNPVSGFTTISCHLGNKIFYKNAVIKIFTSHGDLLKILPIPNQSLSNEINIDCDFSNFAQGSYYYNLEIDGKKVATNQILVVK